MGRGAFGLATRLEEPDLEHLARIVPLVDGRVDVKPLVALEADEARAERRGEDLGQFRLADSGLALEKKRATELERQEHRGRDGAVGDVVARAKIVLDRLDGARPLG